MNDKDKEIKKNSEGMATNLSSEQQQIKQSRASEKNGQVIEQFHWSKVVNNRL